jgi:cytochrome c oxidase cbb3-type subunit 1/cytochrome c oxidase cbb3-type subunit I/II
VQRITHYNNWVVAHAHIGVLGFAGVTALGGLYFILPRITGRPLHSALLADLQYWLVLIGITGFGIVLTIVGLIQGQAWYNGETLYRTLPEIQPYYVTRLSLGALIMAGAYIGLYNVIRSLYFNRGVASCE